MVSSFRIFAAAVLLATSLVAPWGAAAVQGEITAGPDAREDLRLVVYNLPFALVQERRSVTLTTGENRIAITGLSPMVEPGSVVITGNGLELIEQSHRFEALDPQRLLEAHVGQTIGLVRVNPVTGEESTHQARVLSVRNGTLLEVDGRIETSLGGAHRLVFDRLPAELTATPVMRATFKSRAAGAQEVDVSYLTGGMQWLADYVAEYADGQDKLSLTVMATLTNLSEVDYENAQVSFVAGSPSRAEILKRVPRVLGSVDLRGQIQGFMQQRAAELPEGISVGDQHLYAVNRQINIAHRETKQLVIYAGEAIPFRREYRLPSLSIERKGELYLTSKRKKRPGPMKANAWLAFENDRAAGLGAPLPWGVVRVYERKAGGTALIGETSIGHTPRNETVRINLGEAFDISAQARRTAHRNLGGSDYEAAYEVAVKNARDREVAVKIPWLVAPGWHILEESTSHEQEDSNKLTWTLRVPANSEGKLAFTIRIIR